MERQPRVVLVGIGAAARYAWSHLLEELRAAPVDTPAVPCYNVDMAHETTTKILAKILAGNGRAIPMKAVTREPNGFITIERFDNGQTVAQITLSPAAAAALADFIRGEG